MRILSRGEIQVNRHFSPRKDGLSGFARIRGGSRTWWQEMRWELGWWEMAAHRFGVGWSNASRQSGSQFLLHRQDQSDRSRLPPHVEQKTVSGHSLANVVIGGQRRSNPKEQTKDGGTVQRAALSASAIVIASEAMFGWFGTPNDEDLPSVYQIEYVRAWKLPATEIPPDH